MINIPPIKQSGSIKPEIIPDVTRSWKVGQVLNATTQRGGETLSNVLIRVGQQTIEAKTPITLQTGQDIKLLVKSVTDNQQPLLSIITTTPTASDKNLLAAQKLRQFIAIQQTLSQLQSVASELLNNKLMADKLPQSVKILLNNIQQGMQLNTNNINPAQLKQKILNSGIFLESKIQQQTTQNKNEPNFFSDIKFQLLSIKSELSALLPTKQNTSLLPLTSQQIEQIQAIIKQSSSNLSGPQLIKLADNLITLLPKPVLLQLSNLLSGLKPDSSFPDEIQTLAKLLSVGIQSQGTHQAQQLQEQLQFRLMLLDLGQQVEQTIGKITSLQLQPLLREGDNLILLLFNLTFKDSHEHFDIEFRFQQDTEEENHNEESWSVTLNFNFKTLGIVQAKIHLVDDRVSSSFYTESASTAEKIKQLLPLLQSGLTKTGLNIVNLSVENKPPENTFINKHQVNLLDENA